MRLKAIPFKLAAVIVIGLFATVPAAIAQANSQLSQYTSAVAHVQPAERLVQLEQFSIHAQPGPLKIDALEFVIWEYLRTRNLTQAVTWAKALATTDKDNAVALAVLSEQFRSSSGKDKGESGKLLTMATHGLETLPMLRRPLGMNPGDFEQLKNESAAMLNGAAGWANVQLKNYVQARVYLRSAVAAKPQDAQNAYGLALADLNGSNPDRREGYWYLARAVNLSKGSAQGSEIESFARASYIKDGGNPADWNQFLRAAGGSRVSTAEPPMLAVANSAPPDVRPKSPAAQTAAAVLSSSRTDNRKPAPSIWAPSEAELTPPVIRRHVVTASGPMSLGILVETSLANGENRRALVNSLTDMLRRMGDDDQAFILAYDNNMVFEQDLTSDPKQLEEAMESIKPRKGTVLEDAIAFAAGHLARIAKNPNRVLLVISDGSDLDSHASPLQTSAEINAAGVRIYCIGVNVNGADGRYRLQALSSSTGGQSSFISGPEQFRTATKEIARNMGIDFRF